MTAPAPRSVGGSDVPPAVGLTTAPTDEQTRRAQLRLAESAIRHDTDTDGLRVALDVLGLLTAPTTDDHEETT